MNNDTARLRVRYGTGLESEYLLVDDTTNLGREPFNEIVLNFPEVSRRHARIIARDGGYLLEDVGSTNGTFVNGQRVTERVWLESGDELDIAESAGFTFLSRESVARTIGPVPRARREPVREELLYDEFASEFDQEPVEAPPPPPTRYERRQIERAPEPLVAAPVEEREEGRGCARWLLGCVLLFLILSVGCVALVFFLDYYPPTANLLYCDPTTRPYLEVAADIITALDVMGPRVPPECPIR